MPRTLEARSQETSSTTSSRRTALSGEDASADAQYPPSVFIGSDPQMLRTEILSTAMALHHSRYRLIKMLAAYDESGDWALTGANTCAHWVADQLGIRTGTAREWLRVGHALEKLPLVDEAMGRGDLSYCAVRSLTRIALDHPDHEEELVDLAVRSRACDLSRVLAGWALGHDTEEQREERERRGTWFSAAVEPDGMGMIRVRLPVVDMGLIQAAVDARVMQSHPSEPGYIETSLGRRRASLGYQRARALIGLMAGANQGDRPVASSAEVVVHVRSDGCTMHDGTPVADSTVASLLDDAFVRLLIHDAENRPVNASVRRRHPTTRQKRVVDEREPRCVDCGGTELLEYDHQPAYSISGQTHTDELVRRCAACHRRRHSGPVRE